MADQTPAQLLVLFGNLTLRQRLTFALIVVLMTLGAAMELLSIGALFPVIKVMQSPEILHSNEYLADLGGWLGNPTDHEYFVTLLLSLLLLFVLKNVYLVFLDVFQYRFMARVQGQLSTHLMAGYLRRPYAFHLVSNSAQLVRNVTSEVNTVFYYALAPVVSLLSETLVVLALFILFFCLDRAAAGAVVGVGGMLVLLFYFLFRVRMSVIGRKLQETSGKMIQLAQEALGGVKEIKMLGREPFFEKAFGDQASLNARMLGRALVIHNFPAHVLEAIFAVIFICMLIFLALRGSTENAIPLIGVYAAAAFRLIPSLNRIMTATSRLRQGGASVALVGAETSVGSEEMSGAPTGSLPFEHAIDVVGVHYRYPGAASESLKGITLKIDRGEMVGFVGKSGSGKTTLIDCILGLLPPSQGSIRVDGQDIQENLARWRGKIGYIPQNIYLSDESICRNVAFGIPDAEIDVEKIWRAIETAQLMELVTSLPAGIHSEIGERGVRLSGGQRQRIGIARAMYHDPEVLILDEATSALDTETEKAIVRTIGGLKGAKTILVIAHRTSTVQDCDRIIRIQAGELVAVA